jgi:hypothetical protein
MLLANSAGQGESTEDDLPHIQCANCLGPAPRASRGVTRLGGLFTFLGSGTVFHHDSEVNLRACRVLVTVLTGVESRAVWAVSLPCLVRVEVINGTRGGWVPSGVNLVLGRRVPFLSVVLSVVKSEELGAHAERSALGRKGVRRGDKGKSNARFGQLVEERTCERQGDESRWRDTGPILP